MPGKWGTLSSNPRAAKKKKKKVPLGMLGKRRGKFIIKKRRKTTTWIGEQRSMEKR
jgi:hypothetical protein